ncbi:hypothetical protein [Streptomyces sp. NBC_01022]|uniref:hypothetical protein n=1 Tax=Streptomyces sp. NBC_01022 TaxID=2903723 RepID=UPI002DDAE68C|nr:hypothetical protein [Streptomyces sp. NBC_01022]WRZ83817.1 hypothetical protein OG316_28000 [Streptomyces sp. NBC_01022]
MRGAHRLLAGLLTAGALLTVTAGCAQSVDPIERLGRKAAQRMNPSPSAPEVRPAAVRGDHGVPGAMVVVACGRPAAAGDSRVVRPPVRWWPERPERPGSRDGAVLDAGCRHG